MNISILKILIVFTFCFLLFGCGKSEIENNPVLHDYRVNDVLYAKDSNLKRVYRYHTSDNSSRVLYAEYDYDEFGRISRIGNADKNETYLYNTKGLLEKILRYKENSLTLISSVIYSYDVEGLLKEILTYIEDTLTLINSVVYFYDDEGNKIKEQVFSHNGMLGVTHSYEYTDGKLTKHEIVVDGQSPQIIFHEYKGDKQVKLKSYFMDNCGVTEYFYDQNLLILTIGYNENNPKFVNSEVKYYYDRNDNLIRTTVDDRLKGIYTTYPPDDGYDGTEYEYE